MSCIKACTRAHILYSLPRRRAFDKGKDTVLNRQVVLVLLDVMSKAQEHLMSCCVQVVQRLNAYLRPCMLVMCCSTTQPGLALPSPAQPGPALPSPAQPYPALSSPAQPTPTLSSPVLPCPTLPSLLPSLPAHAVRALPTQLSSWRVQGLHLPTLSRESLFETEVGRVSVPLFCLACSFLATARLQAKPHASCRSVCSMCDHRDD